jgi:hypothetical protein
MSVQTSKAQQIVRKRIKAAERIRLQKLMEENNAKSPDIITAIAYPETQWEACQIAGIFLDCTGYKLPFSFDEWQRTVRIPVELYFRFDRKKDLMRFLKSTRKELPHIAIRI